MKKNNIWVVILMPGKDTYTYSGENARGILKTVKTEHMDCMVRTFKYYGKTITKCITVRDVCNYLSQVCENDSKAIQTACEQKLKNLALKKEKAENEPHTKAQGHMRQIEEQNTATRKLKRENVNYNKDADTEKDQMDIMDIFGGLV